MDVAFHTLRNFDTFDTYGDAELRVLCAVLETRTFTEGQVVCRQGEPGNSCFVLLEGSLQVERVMVEVGMRVMGTLLPGAIFGQISLIDGGPRVTTCRAVGHVVVAELSHGTFTQLFQEGSEFAVRFQLEVARALVRQLRLSNQRLSEIEVSLSPREEVSRLSDWLEGVMASPRVTLF